MKFTRVLIIMVVAMALAACSTSTNNSNDNADNPVSVIPNLLASGGTSTSGSGGSGGYVYVQSYGAVKVLKSGTVDANFDSSVSTPTLGVGSNPAVISGGTTTLELVSDPTSTITGLYAKPGDPYLYLGDGDGDTTDDFAVTDLIVDAGATLVLADQGYWGGYGTVWLSNNLVVNGTITSSAPSVYIEANIIDVESGGKITTSATVADTNAGDLYLGNGNNITKTIINRGTIEAKGFGTGSGGYLYFDIDDLIVNHGTIDASGGSSATGSGGVANEIDIYVNNASGKLFSFGSILAKGGDSSDSNGSNGGTGGYLYLDVPDLVVNTGTIDVSGGASDAGSGGSGGEFDVYVNYGDFNSSGTVRMNGGKGATYGGDTEYWAEDWNAYSAYIETAYSNNDGGRNGAIIISGTWEANGGDGNTGNGGYGGYIYLQTDAMGAVTINATMSVRGGNSAGAGLPGGSASGIDIYSNNYSTVDPVTPGKIRIAGQYDLRGGNGDESGGNGGYLNIYNYGYNAANIGSDVELVGFVAMNLNGGDGANGGSASGSAIQLYTYSPGGMPAGPITNEANIEARGGNAAAASGSYGGSGSTVAMMTYGISDPSEVITNSGSIDISGGTGDVGGSSTMINLGAQHITNSGILSAKGANGTTTGGNGGNIYLTSNDSTTPTTNTGTLSVIGGTPGGSPGTITGGPI
jgi:hypothetical protein